jgi:hypothetical protein
VALIGLPAKDALSWEAARMLVDEEINELVLVDFMICLLGSKHIFSKQTSQLIGFAMY